MTTMAINGLNLPLPDDLLQEVAAKGKDFALCKGILMRTKEEPNSSEVLNYAPFTLFPSVLPRSCFQEALDAQTDFNHLMFLVASDHEFLYESLKSVLDTDDFIKNLWNIYITVREEKSGQPIICTLARSDYMVDMKEHNKPQIKQIEMNTIAAGFSGLSSELTHVHRYNLNSCGITDTDSNLPENKASTGLAKGLVTAWEAYGNKSAAVLFLIETESRNIFDQRCIEHKIYELNKNVKVIRRNFLEVHANGKLTEDNKLIIDGVEIAVVYFRCGYVPSQIPSNKEWESLLTLERSKAIKCPPVQSHLSGCKKIQQVLAQPGSLERFIKDPVTVKKLRKTFAGLYTLDLNDDGDKAVAMALKNPDHYVMKPQREGGGNNLYGEDIVKELERVKGTEERAAYILMERIFPSSQNNYLLKSGGKVELSSILCELGIYGSIVGSKDGVIENRLCGHLVRTKTSGTDDGGVNAGFAGIDSPYLTD